MKNKPTIEEVLRWRFDRAEAEAPPAPRAAQLLERARPWWETWPARSRAVFEQLGRIQLAYGHAMVAGGGSAAGHPVPVLDLRGEGGVETSARVLYFNVRDGQLRLRFQLKDGPAPPEPVIEVTFVTDDARPLFTVTATLSVDQEYRIDTVLPEALAGAWAGLRVTDRLPFRFILGSVRDQ